MSVNRAPLALYDVEEAAGHLRAVLGDHSVEEIESDFVLRAAAERYVEIISEASRSIEPSWKSEHPEVPWTKIAGIGNVLRHRYRAVRMEVIVGLRTADLATLEAAVANLLQKYDPEGLIIRERLRASGEL